MCVEGVVCGLYVVCVVMYVMCAVYDVCVFDVWGGVCCILCMCWCMSVWCVGMCI